MQVLLRPRSLDIGGNTYPLQNIARVGIWKYTFEANTHYKWALALGILALICFSAGDVGVLFGLLSAAGSGALMWKSMAVDDTHLYSLRLETSGSPTDAIFSHDIGAVRNLRDQIVDHMEEPEAAPTTIDLGHTFISGDQVNVGGHNNVGKAVS